MSFARLFQIALYGYAYTLARSDEDSVDTLHLCSTQVASICLKGSFHAVRAEAMPTRMRSRGNPFCHADWARPGVSRRSAIIEDRFHHVLLIAQGRLRLYVLSCRLGELVFHSLSFSSFLHDHATGVTKFVEDLLPGFVVLHRAHCNRTLLVCLAEAPEPFAFSPIVLHFRLGWIHCRRMRTQTQLSAI